MGSWNETCMITNMPILDDEEVLCFFIKEEQDTTSRCYVNAFWSPLPWFVYGRYNGYGAIHEETVSGIGTQYLTRILQTRCKAPSVTSALALDHNGILAIKDYSNRVPMRHALIKMSFVDMLLKMYPINFYSYKEGSYTDWYYEDIIGEIPRIKKVIKDHFQKVAIRFNVDVDDKDLMLIYLDMMSIYDRSDFAVDMLITTDYGSSRGYERVDIYSILYETPERQWDGIIRELYKFSWINHFMKDSRKWWVPAAHSGSQTCETEPYLFLADYYVSEVDRILERYEYNE